MPKVELSLRKDGKPSLWLREHAHLSIRVTNPGSRPYSEGSDRARAWDALHKMNGWSVQEVHDELRRLEPGIQGYVGRPLGWVVDALDLGNLEVHDDAT